VSTDRATHAVTPPADLLEMAAEYRWANPSVTWDEVAAKVGRTRKCLWEWRQTEAWEIAFRNAGTAHMGHMAPHAAAGLLKAWSKGNPAGALDVLTRLGFLRPTELRIEQATPSEADLKALDRLRELKLMGLLPGEEPAGEDL
jgi:hypothetical protein